MEGPGKGMADAAGNRVFKHTKNMKKLLNMAIYG